MERITSSLEGAKLLHRVDIWSDHYGLRIVNCPSKAYLFTDGQRWEIVVRYRPWKFREGPTGAYRTARRVSEKLEPAIKELVKETEIFDYTDFAVWLFFREWAPDYAVSPADAFRIGNWSNANKHSRYYRP